METKTYIGIDNGVTGTLGMLRVSLESGLVIQKDFCKIPVFSQQSYTKKKGNITRVQVDEFLRILNVWALGADSVFVALERPMVNPGRLKATLSAMRCLEAVLICLEMLDFDRRYIDSKEWQKEFFPEKPEKGETKRYSSEVGSRLFTEFTDKIKKYGDADGLLIAEYCRRQKY